MVERFAAGNQTKAAKKMNVTPQSLSRIIGGGSPHGDTLAAILRAYPRVNPDWLLTGEGAPERDVQPALQPVTRQELEDLADVLGVASGMVEALRARYEAERPQPAPTPAPAPGAVRARVLGRRSAVLRKQRPPEAQRKAGGE